VVLIAELPVPSFPLIYLALGETEKVCLCVKVNESGGFSIVFSHSVLHRLMISSTEISVNPAAAITTVDVVVA
jgi:hypothetical protein